MTLTYRVQTLISIQEPRKCSDELLRSLLQNKLLTTKIIVNTLTWALVYSIRSIVPCRLKMVWGLEQWNIVCSSCMLREWEHNKNGARNKQSKHFFLYTLLSADSYLYCYSRTLCRYAGIKQMKLYGLF